MAATAKGVLSSVVTGASAVLAGSFACHWAVDYKIIWQTPSNSAILAAVAYYQDQFAGPHFLFPTLAGIATVAVAATLFKLLKGSTSRILFDGGSLFLLAAAIFIYAQNVVPALRIISHLPRASDKIPQAAFGSITQIASAHAVIATALTGVVLLQGAQSYSDRQVEKQVRKELKDAGISTSGGTPAKVRQGNGASTGLSAPIDSSQNLRRSPRKKR